MQVVMVLTQICVPMMLFVVPCVMAKPDKDDDCKKEICLSEEGEDRNDGVIPSINNPDDYARLAGKDKDEVEEEDLLEAYADEGHHGETFGDLFIH